MQFTVGSSAISVTALGRIFIAGNTGSHAVKLVRASTAVDVPGASATVSMASGTSGQFVYAPLSVPVTLAANATYYLMSLEVAGGDQWYDLTPVLSTAAATVNYPVYFAGNSYFPVGVPGSSYVPLSLRYAAAPTTPPPTVSVNPVTQNPVVGSLTVTATASAATGLTVASVQFQVDGIATGAPITSQPYSLAIDTTKLTNGAHQVTAAAKDSSGNSATSAAVSINVLNPTLPPPLGKPLILGQNLGTVRNNFSGFLGMRFTVGSAAITVSSLGRFVVSGNSGSHVVKLVRASDGADVAGGSVTVGTGGATAGAYQYKALASAITLPAGTSYYLVSQEVAGGDQWYDYCPVANNSGVTIVEPVYDAGGYYVVPAVGYSYVPVNLLYQ